jgi:hypothetical protein
MKEYKLSPSGSVLKLVNGEYRMSIPPDETLPEYQEYLKWLSAGNEPDPADSEPVQVKYVPCKDIILRLDAMGKYELVKSAMSEVQKDIFFSLKEGIDTQDAEVRALLVACGIDPDLILY